MNRGSPSLRYGWLKVALPLLPCLLLPTYASGAEHTRLPVVTVTSEKTEQPIEQVPASVTAISGNAIKHTQTSNFQQLSSYVANATIDVSPDSGQLSVRGFATPNSNPGFDPSVGTIVDGVYYGRSQFLTAFFYDIGSLEVLRGPQGTLFGKNVSGGVLNLKTAKPRNQLLLRAEYLMTSNGSRSFRPVVQLPLGNNLSLRAAANLDHGNRGVLFNTDLQRHENNPQQDSARVRLRYTPTAALVIDVEGYMATLKQHENIFQLSKVRTQAMRQLMRSYDPNVEFNGKNRLNSSNFPSENDVDIRGLSINAAYDLAPPWAKSGATVRNIIGYGQARTNRLDLDADFSPVPFVTETLAHPSPYRQFSEELRISGHTPSLFGFGHKFTYVAGVYYSRSTFEHTSRFNIQDLGATVRYILAGNPDLTNGQLPLIGPLATQLLGTAVNNATTQQLINTLAGAAGFGSNSAISGLEQVDSSYATYGQVQWFFVPHWSIIAGARLGLEHKTGAAFSQSDSVLIPAIAGQKNFRRNLSILERDFSPKLGVQWSPNKRSSVYATWTRGYKSGGFNALALNASSLSFGPERADSYELGAKTLTQLWGTALRVSADVYWTRFKNLQVSTLKGLNFQVLNAAAARSRGFETDLEWLPFKNASLHFSAGYSNARYTSYPNAPATYAQTAATGQQTQDLAGARLAFAPRWTLDITPGYTVSLPYTLKAHAFFDVLYKSGRFLDIDDDRANKYQPGTTILNARLIFNDASGMWALGLVAHNLSNRVVLDQVVNEPEAPGNFAAVRTDLGRYYSADITFSFK